jgi:cysteine desulfurase
VGAFGWGRVRVEDLVRAVASGTVRLVHVQLANHEVATLQPVAEVAAAIRSLAPDVLVHVDAACAAGVMPVSFHDIGADLMSVSGHKLGGPPGTGALLVRRGLRLPPMLVGGAQERARRAGFENVAALIGFGAACAAVDVDTSGAHARRLTGRVLALARSLDGVAVFGDPDERVPHIVCLGVDGVEAEAVLLGLDQAGIAAHSGSACSSEMLEPSPVLEAMGVPAERSLRISVGWSSTDADIDALEHALPQVITRLRALGRPSSPKGA